MGIYLVNPYPAKLNNLSFQAPKVVSRKYRGPQLHMAGNHLYVFNLTLNICESWCLNMYVIPKSCGLIS